MALLMVFLAVMLLGPAVLLFLLVFLHLFFDIAGSSPERREIQEHGRHQDNGELNARPSEVRTGF